MIIKIMINLEERKADAEILIDNDEIKSLENSFIVLPWQTISDAIR